MTIPSPQEVTLLLRNWCRGDQAALDKLIPLVYDQLHRLAHMYMVRERPGHTLQTSALVNEAYLRLIDASQIEWQDRAHFFAVSANVMRRILLLMSLAAAVVILAVAGVWYFRREPGPEAPLNVVPLTS